VTSSKDGPEKKQAASRPEFTSQWLQTLPAGPIQTEIWITRLPEGSIKEAAA